jgi:tRNA1(Val) A37 N6-methylase TrmN6
LILQGVKGSRAPFSIAPGIVLHEEDGTPTPIANAILRDGARLL